jgi:ribosomal protein S27AE
MNCGYRIKVRPEQCPKCGYSYFTTRRLVKKLCPDCKKRYVLACLDSEDVICEECQVKLFKKVSEELELALG